MRRTHKPFLLALAVAVLLSALPSGSAGTASAPEIADDKDDARDELDLRSLWIDGNNTTVVVHLTMKAFPARDDTAPCAQGSCQGIAVAYRVFFRPLRPDGTTPPLLPTLDQVVLEFRYGWGDDATAATIAYADHEGAIGGTQPIAATAAGARIDFTVPRSHPYLAIPDGPTPGAYRLNATLADSRVVRCAPGAGDIAASCATVSDPGVSQAPSARLADRAPDAGTGADFVFAAPPGPPADAVTVTVTSTATVTATDTRTATVDRVSHTVSVLNYTASPFPRSLAREGLPGPGVALLAVLVVGAVAVRRRL